MCRFAKRLGSLIRWPSQVICSERTLASERIAQLHGFGEDRQRPRVNRSAEADRSDESQTRSEESKMRDHQVPFLGRTNGRKQEIYRRTRKEAAPLRQNFHNTSLLASFQDAKQFEPAQPGVSRCSTPG